MGYAEFQADWERAAAAEYEQYLSLTGVALLAQVRSRTYGECYQIWRAVAARATLAQAGWALLDVLRRDSEPYLIRYHAAGALLALLGAPVFQPVELSRDYPQRAQNLDTVEGILKERLPPRYPA
jgi:hypothetical protein